LYKDKTVADVQIKEGVVQGKTLETFVSSVFYFGSFV